MKWTLVFAIVLGSVHLVAQNINDAVRLNTIDYQGTARFSALGGAMGALGGDFSNLSTNPAGLGVLRRSEFTISPSLFLSRANSTYNNETNSDGRTHFTLGNMGLLINSETGKQSGILELTWGFGYNRQQSFYRRYRIEGANPGTSLLDVFEYDLTANGLVDPGTIGIDPSLAFGPALAWETFLIDFDETNQEYFHANEGYEGMQEQTVEVRGSVGEYILGIGANYNSRLYFGASVAFSSVRYRFESTYSETPPDSAAFTTLRRFNFEENLFIDGLGIQGKLGIIYRANDFARFGIAYHTPMRVNMEDEYQNAMESEFTNGDEYAFSSLVGTYTYGIRKPGRLLLSSGFVFGKQGLLGIDYELVDNSRLRIQDGQDGYDFAFENQTIEDRLTWSHHLRIGAEYRLRPFALRAGFRYDGSPYGSDHSVVQPGYTFSTGAGFRNARYFLDLAWKWNLRNETSWMYDPAFVPETSTRINEHYVTFTFGYRWQ